MKKNLPKKVIIKNNLEVTIRVVGGESIQVLPIEIISIMPKEKGFRIANSKLKYSLGHLDK